MGKEKSDVIHFGQTSKICHKYFNEAVQLLSAEFMQTGSVVEKMSKRKPSMRKEPRKLWVPYALPDRSGNA